MTTETSLIQWNKIKAEIINATDIIILGQLNYSLEAIQKWAKQSKQSLESQNEIAEYRVRLNRKQGEWIERNIPEEGYSNLPTQNGRQDIPTLSEAGIDKHDSPKFRTLAQIPEDRFEAIITEIKEAGELTTNEVCYSFNKNIASRWTGEQENYTPSLYIEAARSVMGSIDCDPASSDIAQQVVKATRYFTKQNDGLRRVWEGNIFLNPPYSHPLVAHFVDKLLSDIKPGQQAILLTNNNTDTNFFHKAAHQASALCFTKGRISFYKEDTETKTAPTNGQVFFYFGSNIARFCQVFVEFGLLMRVL